MRILPLDEMVDCYKLSIDYPHERDYGMSLIYSVAVRNPTLLAPLDFWPYINFWGAPVSGKTEATLYLAKISNGFIVQKCTPAYLLRKMEDVSKASTLLAIDQYDDHVKAVDDLDGIMEIGHRPSAIYGLTEKEKSLIKLVGIHCGGPKVFNSLIPPRPALRSRTWEVHMKKSPKASQFATYSNLHDISMLTYSLDHYAKKIQKRFGPRSVSSYIQSDAHRLSIQPLASDGRKVQIANVFECVRHMLGWDVDVIGALHYTNHDEDLDVLRDVLGTIVEERGWKDSKQTPQTVLTAINEKYRTMNADGFRTARALGGKMAELGIEGEDCRKRMEDTNYYVFSSVAMSLIHPSGQTTLPLLKPIWGTAHLRRDV